MIPLKISLFFYVENVAELASIRHLLSEEGACIGVQVLLLWGCSRVKKSFICWETSGLYGMVLLCFSIWGSGSGEWGIG